MIRAATIVRWLVAGVATAAALLAIARASAVPLAFHGSDSGRLRLSWSARPERIELCRTLSAEELAQRPEHMRQRVECDGRSATYTLRVEADGRRIDETVIRGAGLQHDRSIYLLRDFNLPTGVHRVRVSFTRRETTDDDAAAFAPAVSSGADTGIFAGRAEREAIERARRAQAAIPSRLLLDTLLTLAPRRVTIITYNRERRALELVNEEPLASVESDRSVRLRQAPSGSRNRRTESSR